MIFRYSQRGSRRRFTMRWVSGRTSHVCRTAHFLDLRVRATVGFGAEIGPHSRHATLPTVHRLTRRVPSLPSTRDARNCKLVQSSSGHRGNMCCNTFHLLPRRSYKPGVRIFSCQPSFASVYRREMQENCIRLCPQIGAQPVSPTRDLAS